MDAEIKEDLGYFFEEDLLTKIQQLSTQEMGIAVLIIPPDKSMAIFSNREQLLLVDSHEHGPHGSIIATCPSGCVQDFVTYISRMAREVWNTWCQPSNTRVNKGVWSITVLIHQYTVAVKRS